MSYAVRNTLFLAAFWAIIIAIGGYYTYGVQTKTLLTGMKANKQKENRIEILEEMKDSQQGLIESYDRLKDLSMGKMGVLAGNETPGETFDYIRRDLLNIKASLIINLEFQQQDLFISVNRHIYSFTGEGKFLDLYRLIWFLENGPIFYNIRSIMIARTDPLDFDETVRTYGETTFKIQFWGFNKPGGMDMMELGRESTDLQQTSMLYSNAISKNYDTIRRRFNNQYGKSEAQKEEPKEKPQEIIPDNLAQITRDSQILAITSNLITVQDARGKIFSLRRGDPVYRGRLERIDIHNGSVIFAMNLNGFKQSIELSISNEK